MGDSRKVPCFRTSLVVTFRNTGASVDYCNINRRLVGHTQHLCLMLVCRAQLLSLNAQHLFLMLVGHALLIRLSLMLCLELALVSNRFLKFLRLPY